MKNINKENCIDNNHRMGKYLETCLLLLIYDDVGYGYRLLSGLEKYGFKQSELNVGTLYRSLRKMETKGLVLSFWQDSGIGPKRRVYKITKLGKKELSVWIAILKIKKNRIENLILSYEEKISK